MNFRPRAALLLIAVLIHVPLWLSYQPITSDDTGTYLEMARQLAHWDFSAYTGKRPPGYPLFLLILGENPGLVWIAQSILGILTVMLVYELVWEQTNRRAALAFGAGLATACSLNLLLFESAMLTETVATFLLALVFWLLWRINRPSVAAGSLTPPCVAMGLVLGLAALTKPYLQYALVLVPLFAAHMAWNRVRRWQTAIKAAVLTAIPAVALVSGWATFNNQAIDYYGISTLTGYNLTQHSGAVMEYAPDEYARVRDIYLRYRAPRIERTGSHTMTIWEAYPEMMRETGQSFPELSKTLARLSVTLLVTHPRSYAGTASEAWLKFWKAPLSPLFLEAPNASDQLLATLKKIWFVERYLLVAAKAGFLLIALLAAVRLATSPWEVNPPTLALLISVLAGSVLQALTEYGENARYSIVFQPLIFAVLFSGLPFSRDTSLSWHSRSASRSHGSLGG